MSLAHTDLCSAHVPAWATARRGRSANESDENVIESVTLTYDFFKLVQ